MGWGGMGGEEKQGERRGGKEKGEGGLNMRERF